MRAFSIFAAPKGLPEADRLQRRHMLARLGLAWLVMMQVMMFAFPGYLRSDAPGPDSISLLDRAIFLMNWISLVLTMPVILYCAWPVWSGMVARVRNGQVGMDVPVALGIVAAFIPSVYSTWVGHGQVYFESVSMFVAFLLTARYLEFCARQSINAGRLHQYIEQCRAVLSTRADRIALWFTVIQIALSLVGGLIWFVYAPGHAVAVMVALLVISCPCAMAMAVPTAIAAAHASILHNPALSESDLQGLIQATESTSRQNLYGSMGWHLLMMPLAAMGWVQPWLAAITMLLSSLAVAANSWRLFKQTRTFRSALQANPV
ncbi:MAG TPA: hypothetical protein VIP51_04925 [Eoetvoesiella sp.]